MSILLVEGPTEVRTVQQLLRLYRQDHRYVPIPLGGGELINIGTEHQLAELRRLSETVVALIDSEKNAAEKELSNARAGFGEACKKADIRLHVLERRALENYFTARAITQAVGRTHPGLAHFEKLNSQRQDWPKADNWKIANWMTKDEIDPTDLGEFLRSL